MPTYAVELYVPRSGSDGLREAAVRARAAEAAAETSGRVRYVRSIFLPDDEVCFHVYEADSRSEVHEASTRARIAFERILEANDV